MVGKDAKKAGTEFKKAGTFDGIHLNWKGKTFLRDSNGVDRTNVVFGVGRVSALPRKSEIYQL